MRLASVCAAVLFVLVGDTVGAQQRVGLPVTMSAGLDQLAQAAGIPPLSADEGLPGAAVSPDGRLLLFAARNGCDPDGGWHVAVLKHEAMVVDTAGHPRFAGPNNALEAWSAPVLVGQSAATAGRLLTPTKPMWQLVWMAMAPDPAFRGLPCPFPSDSTGAYLAGPTTHATYKMLIVAADQWRVKSAVPTDLVSPNLAYANLGGACPGGGPNMTVGDFREVNPIGMRWLTVVVSAPGTTNAAVSSVSISDGFPVMMFQPDQVGAQPRPLIGIEPTLSLDGRLLMFQGNAASMTANWATTATTNGHILFSYNATPGALGGWSEPKSLHELYSKRNVALGNFTVGERFPIARKELRDANGFLLPKPMPGAYPWLTLDGTDVTFTTVASPTVGVGRVYGVSILGASTHWRMRHVDGPLNSSRLGDDRRRVLTGTGISPGAWRWGGQSPELPLPYAPAQRTMSMFSANPRTYAEVPLDAGLDNDIVLALDMNEGISPPVGGSLSWNFNISATPNTANLDVAGGAGAMWQLTGGAGFGVPNLAKTPYSGAIGEHVWFANGLGRVSTASHPALNQSFANATLSLWVKLDAGGVAGQRRLVRKGAAFELRIDQLGTVTATATDSAGVQYVSAPVPTPAASEWTHVALAFDTGNDRMSLWVDGVEFWSTALATSVTALRNDPAGFVVGPDGASAFPGDTLRIDQLRFDRVARDAREIAALAHVEAEEVMAPLPDWMLDKIAALGRDPSHAHMSVNGPAPTTESVVLGEALFFDPGLSPSAVSCATCHVANLDFTDGMKRAASLTGVSLRNTPTVLDRAWSGRQLWDGLAAELEVQAKFPLESPHEMASSAPFVLGRIAQNPYPALFAAAFPGATPSYTLVQHALAHYQRALISFPSPADQFESGDVSALSASELAGRNLFFGKARCFACHSGPNFTDEDFHVTIAGDNNDAGRGGITARARDQRRFKTPTLRHLPTTAPYFHDGSAATLEDVLLLYVAGGSSGHAQDEEIFPLDLTDHEIQLLVEYLEAIDSSWTRL